MVRLELGWGLRSDLPETRPQPGDWGMHSSRVVMLHVELIPGIVSGTKLPCKEVLISATLPPLRRDAEAWLRLAAWSAGCFLHLALNQLEVIVDKKPRQFHKPGEGRAFLTGIRCRGLGGSFILPRMEAVCEALPRQFPVLIYDPLPHRCSFCSYLRERPRNSGCRVGCNEFPVTSGSCHDWYIRGDLLPMDRFMAPEAPIKTFSRG